MPAAKPLLPPRLADRVREAIDDAFPASRPPPHYPTLLEILRALFPEDFPAPAAAPAAALPGTPAKAGVLAGRRATGAELHDPADYQDGRPGCERLALALAAGEPGRPCPVPAGRHERPAKPRRRGLDPRDATRKAWVQGVVVESAAVAPGAAVLNGRELVEALPPTPLATERGACRRRNRV